MGSQTISESVTLVPSSYTGLTNLTTDTSNPVSNGYEDSSSSSYARFTLGTSSTGYLYYTFDTSSIPSNATITSISANFKARVGNTTRVTNSTCQLYTNTTAKGSSTAFASTTASVRTMTVGSWTRAELNDLRLRIGATGSSSTSSKRFDFYGASVTIDYTYTVTTYDITISNTSSATVTASASEVNAGDGVEITASTLDNIIVLDNGIDVTNQFIMISSDSEEKYPISNTSSNFTLTNIDNAYNGSDNESHAQLQIAGSTTGTIYLNFPSITLPTGASLQSITCSVTLLFNRNNSSSGFNSSFQMYSSSTAKGSATTWVSSATNVSKTTYNVTMGTWSANELANVRFYLTATNSARSTVRLIYIYGATLTVTYLIAGGIYVYTISNVNTNHTITVTENIIEQNKLFIKGTNNSWIEVQTAYKKINGSWVLQTDLTSVFSQSINYKKGS